MGELIIILIGAFISGILALLKLAGIVTFGWLGVCVPLIIAVILVGLMCCGDGFDLDF